MDALRLILEGKIDFQGQRLADRINQEVLVMSAMLAFVLGFALQSLSTCLYLYAASVIIAMVACIPPWPIYRRHPVIWLPNRPKGDVSTTVADKKSQ